MKPYVVFSPYHRAWEREPREEVLSAPRKIELPHGIDPGSIPRLQDLRLTQEVEDPMKGGETEAPSSLRTSHGRSRRELSPLAIPPLRLRLAPRGRAVALATQLSLRSAWRDFFHQVLLEHHPRNARRGVPGALPRHACLERRPRRPPRLEGRPHRLPVRRRRDAPAEARGLDPEPRAAGGRLVPHEAARDRLARGRAPLHALPARRRRGQQQRQLAVDRVGGRRPRAVLPPPLQPGAPAEPYDPDGEYVDRYVPEIGTNDYPAPDRRPARGARARRSSATGRRQAAPPEAAAGPRSDRAGTCADISRL